MVYTQVIRACLLQIFSYICGAYREKLSWAHFHGLYNPIKCRSAFCAAIWKSVKQLLNQIIAVKVMKFCNKIDNFKGFPFENRKYSSNWWWFQLVSFKIDLDTSGVHHSYRVMSLL